MTKQPLEALATTVGAKLTPTSLELADDVRFNAWRDLGQRLEAARDANLWWLADWAAHGERVYRKDYGPALEQISRGTIWNLASVSRRIESSRRREDLSFSHHVEVAPLDPDWQTIWLDDAFDHGWNRDELRSKIAEWRGRERTPQSALTFRAVDGLRDLCIQAAERAGLDPSEWVRQALERAARSDLELEAA